MTYTTNRPARLWASWDAPSDRDLHESRDLPVGHRFASDRDPSKAPGTMAEAIAAVRTFQARGDLPTHETGCDCDVCAYDDAVSGPTKRRSA